MIPNEASYGNSRGGRGFIRLLDTLLVPIIVVLVGVAAFGLGRLSATQPQTDSLIVHPAGEIATTTHN